MKHIRFIPILAALAIILVSCGKKIENVPSRVLTYNELPVEVRTYLSKSEDFWNNQDLLLFVNNNERKFYHLETTNIGPWTLKYKLINDYDNTEYIIKRATPRPYFLFNNKLYIPSKYLNLVDDCKSAKFTEYELGHNF